MSTPKRFLHGVTNVSIDNPLGRLPYLDPTKWAIWFDDFLHYDVAQGDAAWILDVVNAGADAVVGPTGVLTLTLTGASDSLGLQQSNGVWQLTSGKKAIFKTRCKIVKAAGGTIGQEGFVIGLTSVQTTTGFMDAPPPTARAFDDGLCFVSYDGTTNIIAMQGENDVFSTEVGCATYADDTWMTLSVYWDGTKSTFYKDDAELCEITTNPPTSVISPVMFFSAGEAKADVFHCDYLFMAVER
jgi:hypothetical protein